MGGHYILFTSLWKMYMYSLFETWVVNFQNWSNKKKSLSFQNIPLSKNPYILS
jgi:hypothetical protein